MTARVSSIFFRRFIFVGSVSHMRLLVVGLGLGFFTVMLSFYCVCYLVILKFEMSVLLVLGLSIVNQT